MLGVFCLWLEVSTSCCPSISPGTCCVSQCTLVQVWEGKHEPDKPSWLLMCAGELTALLLTGLGWVCVFLVDKLLEQFKKLVWSVCLWIISLWALCDFLSPFSTKIFSCQIHIYQLCADGYSVLLSCDKWGILIPWYLLERLWIF